MSMVAYIRVRRDRPLVVLLIAVPVHGLLLVSLHYCWGWSSTCSLFMTSLQMPQGVTYLC
jgi:hypothetical protein